MSIRNEELCSNYQEQTTGANLKWRDDKGLSALFVRFVPPLFDFGSKTRGTNSRVPKIHRTMTLGSWSEILSLENKGGTNSRGGTNLTNRADC